MKKVIEEDIILSPEMKNLLNQIDFSDTFSTSNQNNNIEEITKMIFGAAPSWVKVLMGVRNAMVSLVGLKTEMPKDSDSNFEIGSYIGFFKIFAIDNREVVLGLDDSHLNFRAVIQNIPDQQYNVKVSTLVEYNNSLGKAYMNVIKPFHRLIVKSMVGKAFSSFIL